MGVLYFFLGLIIGIVGLVCVLYPEDIIYLQNFWRFRNVDPSEDYVAFFRFSSFAGIVIAIVMMVCAFFI